MISDVSRDDKDNLQALAPGLDVQSLRRRLKSHKKALNAIEQYRNTKAAHWDIETSAQQKPILRACYETLYCDAGLTIRITKSRTLRQERLPVWSLC